MSENLEFDDESSRLVEEFNASAAAIERRRRISAALALQAGENVLDVGSGPGHQAMEMATVIGATGSVVGIDPAESAISISTQRCAGLSNVHFQLGDVAELPFEPRVFDAVMSSQVFEYLADVPGALREIHRVLRPGARILIHDTEWGALLWHTQNQNLTAKIMEVWDGHLADPHLPQTLGAKLRDAGFVEIGVEPIVHVENELAPGGMSDILLKFVVGYAQSQGIPAAETEAWVEDLEGLSALGQYFFSSNEFIFTAKKPI